MEDTHILVQKMMNAFINYYVDKGWLHSTTQSQWTLYEDVHHLVASIGFVSADYVNGKLILYALLPSHFIGLVNNAGKPIVWNYVQDFMKKHTGVEIAIGKYKPEEHHESFIAEDTIEYLESTWQMVVDGAMTFEQAFLKYNDNVIKEEKK